MLFRRPRFTYEITGVVRSGPVNVRYWKATTFRTAEDDRTPVACAVLKVPPPSGYMTEDLNPYAVAVLGSAKLAAVEVTWADDPFRQGVVVYRDWP